MQKADKICEMKIAIIGAGSLYTSELLEGIADRKESFQVREIVLMDIDEERLSIICNFCKRFARKHQLQLKITKTTNLETAVDEADFVCVQIRTGKNRARIYDEKIPLSKGLIGQETTGAGGFFNALRQIPNILKIAKCVEKINPDAWIVNYANPSGIVTEAILKYTNVKAVGLCAGGMFPEFWARDALDLNDERVEYDYIGLNHLSFAYNMRINGRFINDVEFSQIAKKNPCVKPQISILQKAVLSPYLQYYYQTGDVLKKLSSAAQTRGEIVLDLEKKIFDEYNDPNCCQKSEFLKLRGGGGYSTVALKFMESIFYDKRQRMVVNTFNQGTIPYLPEDACVEIACTVDKGGITPIKMPIPKEIDHGLISVVKRYETLTVETAVEGNREKAMLALMEHPLVRDYEISKEIFEEMLNCFKEYLPQFRKEM